MEAVSRRGWFQAQLAQGAPAAPVDPRGGHRPRRARHGRRAVTSAADAPRVLRIVARSSPLVVRRAAATRPRYARSARPRAPTSTSTTSSTRSRSRATSTRRRRGPLVPRGPARGHAASRPATRRGSASGCASRTPPTARSTPADDFEIVDTEGNVYRPIPLDPKRTRSPSRRSRSGPSSLMPESGLARRRAARSRARCCCSRSRPPRCRTARWSSASASQGTRGDVDLDV